MKAAAHILAPTATLRHLAAFLDEIQSELTVEQAATMAINQWIAAARGQPANIGLPPMRGYQWKSVFLPDGTDLRNTWTSNFTTQRSTAKRSCTRVVR